MKRCSKCQEEKPATLDFFHADKHGPGGLTSQCRVCRQAYKAEQRAKNRRPGEVLPEGYKRCRKCREVKPATLEYFHARKEGAGQLHPRCKECVNAARRTSTLDDVPEGYKRCRKCREVKPATLEYFDKEERRLRQPYGLKYLCKACRAAYIRQRRKERHEQLITYERKRRHAKRAHINASRRKWRDTRKEAVRTYHRIYYTQRREWNSERKRNAYIANKEHFLRRNHRSRMAHIEQRRQYDREYSRRNRAQENHRKKLYKLRLRGVPGTHTLQDIADLYQQQEGKCYYCQKSLNGKYDVDHIIPISREGATNTKANLALACPTCNRSKNNKTPEEWRQWRRIVGLDSD